MNLSLEHKNISTQAKITLYQEDHKAPVGILSRTTTKDKFVLKPNPIMRLDRVIGLHPRFTSRRIYYNQDQKLSREIIYTQANLLLGYYPPQ